MKFGQRKVSEKSGNFISDQEWAPCNKIADRLAKQGAVKAEEVTEAVTLLYVTTRSSHSAQCRNHSLSAQARY